MWGCVKIALSFLESYVVLSLLNVTFSHGMLFLRENVIFNPTIHSDQSVALLSESELIDPIV